ncbi:hypothetical protein P153DRAFT_74594 [Dothidotthia symphoricarpi CBS 119687]|uniref:Uncharacterized protein n=1 Tax=Dothidotthia symphoricarpi CBS 119687 TaxID=1392245 RepID=A0A6A6A7E9_9PLEO|nr:uncharacterized protein P153DRAFT_74594 [Dothidotthia symphoricarpi CBS 119687]KAF2126994.1 hypothetical protein P153DRAFT_74594 [Dothidotthia symphoricarpi CBS 119687]
MIAVCLSVGPRSILYLVSHANSIDLQFSMFRSNFTGTNAGIVYITLDQVCLPSPQISLDNRYPQNNDNDHNHSENLQTNTSRHHHIPIIKTEAMPNYRRSYNGFLPASRGGPARAPRRGQPPLHSFGPTQMPSIGLQQGLLRSMQGDGLMGYVGGFRRGFGGGGGGMGFDECEDCEGFEGHGGYGGGLRGYGGYDDDDYDENEGPYGGFGGPHGGHPDFGYY